MSANAAVAQRLDEMAGMLELLGEDSFRASAHARAARAIIEFPDDVSACDRSRLLAIPGIGARMADKITEFCTTGRLTEYDELRGKVPAGLLGLLSIQGLGARTLRVLWQQGGVTDLASLERIINDGTILGLPRMGAKSVEKLRQAIAFAKSGTPRLWLGRAWALAEQISERLLAHPAVATVEPAGSLRRGRDTVGDIDVLVTLKPGREGAAAEVGELFRGLPSVVQVLSAGANRSSVRVSLVHDTGRWRLEGKSGEESAGPSIQVDLKVLPRASWGAGLLYFTGSKEHNVRLRERAQRKGMTLNEFGLFPEDGGKTPPQDRGVKPLAGETEESVYRALGLEFIPPEVREGAGELERPGPWRLVDLGDIQAELHAHTTASDGGMEIETLALEAKRRGFHTIAVTDHSRSSAVAGGLTVERLREHVRDIATARRVVSGITILAGSEVDILADGTLDYEDEVLRSLDVVVASPHAALSQDTEAATARLVKAIGNPYVNILGHPTGRLINRRRGLEPDMGNVIAAAVENGVALEINAHWMRLDLRDTHVRRAVEAGCLIAINCDVHEAQDFDNLRFGVLTGRRGWLPPEQCINTWPAEKLHAWLRRRR